MFSIKEGEDEPTLINKGEGDKNATSFMPNTDYIKKHTEKLTVIQKKGSSYILYIVIVIFLEVIK